MTVRGRVRVRVRHGSCGGGLVLGADARRARCWVPSVVTHAPHNVNISNIIDTVQRLDSVRCETRAHDR